jgi:hypothetical protein
MQISSTVAPPYTSTTNNNEKSAFYRYNHQVSMRHLEPGLLRPGHATRRGCVDGNRSLSVDKPIGVIHAHSSVLGGTLAPVTVPESTRHDIAEWRPS